MQYLLEEFGHVSWERVLSGPGLENLYRFLKAKHPNAFDKEIAERMMQEDAPIVITTAGLEGTCQTCSQALELFVSLYASEAGNLALKCMARGGVYLAGGIAPQILEKLNSSVFRGSFIAKGRMQSVLEAIPVSVILNEHAALLGAARCALVRYKVGDTP